MGKIMKTITTDFTVVHNTFLRDMEVSLAERGMLMTLLHLPDDWNFSIEGLTKILKDGKYKVASTLNSLREKGYFRRLRLIDEMGRVVDWVYEFSDEPHHEWLTEAEFETVLCETPLPENSDMEQRDMGDKAQSNINKSNIIQCCYDNQPQGDKTEKEKFVNYNAVIKRNIEYDTLCTEQDKFIVDSIKDIIIEACMTAEKAIRIGKKDISADKVRENMLKLNSEHISKLIFAIKNKNIRNFRSYVLTSLYNSAEDSNKPEEPPQEYKTYSTDALEFLAEACDYTFNENQMQYIQNVIYSIIPYCTGSGHDKHDIELERYHFLMQKYLYMQAKDSEKHIRNKFAYFCVILDKEKEKIEKAEKSESSYTSFGYPPREFLL